MRYLPLLLALVTTIAGAQQTARVIGPVEQYNITSFPLYGKQVSPSDIQDLDAEGFVRADTEGVVTVICHGNSDTETIQLTLVAGEFVPCMVRRVKATGTTVATLHVFY